MYANLESVTVDKEVKEVLVSLIGIIGKSYFSLRVLISTSAGTGTFTQKSISISSQSFESYFEKLAKEKIPEPGRGCGHVFDFNRLIVLDKKFVRPF